MTTRIQRAAQLARLRSSQRKLPFGDTLRQLNEIKLAATIQKKPKPSVLLVENSSSPISVLCSNKNKQFVHDLSSLREDLEIKETFETELATIHLLKEKFLQKNSLCSVSIRSLATHHVDDPVTSSFLAHISSTIDFGRNSRFCSRCGAKRVAAASPFTRVCSNCGLEKYPRQSPCAIVFVHDPISDSVLVGLRPGGSPIWSLLAGFCESLESIENCAVREVYEESCITLDRSSVLVCVTQPWPFFTGHFEGTSLMMGCFAETSHSGQIPKANVDELANVKWLPISELEHQWKHNSALLPMKASLARYLMQAFLDSK